MKVLVTGGDGFLGSNLVSHLEAQGCDVVATSRKPSVPGRAGRVFMPFDLACTKQDLLHLLQGVDVVVHLAWGSTPGASNDDPLADFLINTTGTVRLFDACAKAGVSRIVFASSGGQVYGELDRDLISESDTTNPKSAYGVGKLSCEKYLALFSNLYGISGISLRVANLYGPGQLLKDAFGAVPTFLTRLRNAETINLFGGGRYVRDFVYIDDAVQGFAKAIISDAQGAFNISSAAGISIRDIVTMLEQATGISAKLNFLPARHADPLRVVLDNSKARLGFGWSPQTSFADGLALTVQFEQQKMAQLAVAS